MSPQEYLRDWIGLLFLIYVDEVTTIMLSQDSKCILFDDDLLMFTVLSDAHDFRAIQDDNM